MADSSGVKCNERRIQVKGGSTLAIRVWGDTSCDVPDAKRWLCFHGFLDNAATYDRVAVKMILSGYASVMACVDLAGHGQSDKRMGGVYHAVDHIADGVHMAEALGWEKYSLMGHSYGGGIVQAMAAVVPERVLRVVAVEAIGLFSTHPSQFTSTLRDNVLDRDRGLNLQTYSSLEECAARRAGQNFVGSMPEAAALVLVRRGTVAVTGGYIWSCDAAVMRPGRQRLPESFVQDFLRAQRARSRSRSNLTWATLSRCNGGSLFLLTLMEDAPTYAAAAAWNWVTRLGRPLVPALMRTSPTASRIAFIYHQLCRRWACLRRPSLIRMHTGGHHPHLTHPDEFLAALAPWLAASSSSQPRRVANN